MGRSLFSRRLGDEAWQALPPAVQSMHGAEPLLRTEGVADATGSNHAPMRWLRRPLGLPRPGTGQPLTVTFERHGNREVWTLRFSRRRMQSVLEGRPGSPLLYERLAVAQRAPAGPAYTTCLARQVGFAQRRPR